MTETLEKLLRLLCQSVEKTQQNAQQALYVLTDATDAKLAYDLLVLYGIEAKYFPDGNGGKLYVQNDSLAQSETQLAAALNQAPMFKQIKNLMDGQPDQNYTLTLANSPAGQQLTILLPNHKTSPVIAVASVPVDPAAPSTHAIKKRNFSTNKPQSEEDILLAGPTVARRAIPKSFKASATDEDPLVKRILLYSSGRAFTTGSWMLFIALGLGMIFSILVTIKGFLCPDVATDQRDIPAYCPRQAPAKQQ